VLSLVPILPHSFVNAAKQTDGRVLTQVCLRFDVTNLSDKPMQVLDVRVLRPWFCGPLINNFVITSTGGFNGMYSIRNPIPPNFTAQGSANLMIGTQWAGHLLDEFVAPQMSKLTAFTAPDISPLPNYFGSLFLNNVLRVRLPDVTRSLIGVFIRRLSVAIRDYRSARMDLEKCIDCPAGSVIQVHLYMRALPKFEHAIINSCLADLSLLEAIRGFAQEPLPLVECRARLRGAYNTLKHFDERITHPGASPVAAPVWIVDEGLRYFDRKGAEVTLTFPEWVALLEELTGDAKHLSLDMFNELVKRSSVPNL
jgi:hypothetical protein